MDAAARLLADAIASGERLLIVADYDADGATACALGVRALRAFGARVEYLVPNRFEHGYGLTPEIAREAAKRSPDVLITVDNGIAAVEGVAEANRLGMRVLVTDHHLPGAAMPAAACIVNPNQPGCGFPSKHLAGVGVIFYVMLALRAELRARGAFAGQARAEPRRAARPRGARHGGGRGAAGRQQPHPGDAGPRAHPRGQGLRPASRRCCRSPTAPRAGRRVRPGLRAWDRASMPPAGCRTCRSASSA